MTGFSSDAAADVEAALRDAVAKGQTKLILDLRGNPGGFVDAARDIASEFIGSGPIYWQEDARGPRSRPTPRRVGWRPIPRSR